MSYSVVLCHTLPYSFDIGSLTKAGVRQGSGTVCFFQSIPGFLYGVENSNSGSHAFTGCGLSQ